MGILSSLKKKFQNFFNKAKLTINNKKKTITIGGALTFSALTILLLSLNMYGITITTYGDITCGKYCSSPIDINVTNYSLCFSPNFRIYFDDPSKIESFALTENNLPINISGHCFDIGYHKLMLNGIKKNPTDTVKWGVSYGNQNVDPTWLGYSADAFFIELISNRADLTYGEAIFKVKNPTTFNFTVDAINNKFDAQFTKVLGNDINSWNLQVLLNKSYSDNITDYTTVYYPYWNLTENGTVYIENASTIASGWHWNNYTTENWRNIKLNDIFVSGKTYTIKLTATWDAHLGEQSIEWFPSILIQNTSLVQYAWGWWNLSYAYKQTIMINTTGEALTNYYTVNLTKVNTSLLVTTNKMMSNCQDLRIVYNDTTELNRSINSCNNALGNTWIEFKLVNPIGANVNDTNYTMYYGNTTPINNNPVNKSAIYMIGDDFDTYDTNQWTTINTAGTITASNGVLNITAFGGNAGNGWNFGTENKWKNISMPFSLEMGNENFSTTGSNIIIIDQLNATDASSYTNAGLYCDGSTCSGNNWFWFAVGNNPSSGGACAWNKNVMYNRTLIIWNTSLAQYYQNGVLTCTNSSTQNIVNSAKWSIFFYISGRTGSVSQYIDWIKVRKLTNASTVPNVTLIGAEQTAGDTTPPTWNVNGTNNTNPLPLVQVLHYANWSDETGLSGYIFSWNATGATCADGMTNDTWTNTAFSGLTSWSNVTKQVPLACAGKVIDFLFYANDTSNNWNKTTDMYENETGTSSLNYSLGPALTTQIMFNQPTTCSEEESNYFIYPANQTSTQGILNLTNNGTASANSFGCALNSAAPSGYVMMIGNTTGNYTITNTANITVGSNIATSATIMAWLYLNCTTPSSVWAPNIDCYVTS